MRSNTIALFPTAVMKFEDFPITDKEIDNLIMDQDFESMQIENGLVSSEKYLLTKKKNAWLRKKLFHCVDQYMHKALDISHNVSYYFQNSWMMKHRPGDWGQNHIHENSLISGVLYLRVPPNSGDLILHRNRIISNQMNPYINLPSRRPNIYNADSYKCGVGNKALVLFPANMNHSIERNDSTEDRYCIAFNLFFRGIIGEETSVCQIL